MNFANYLINIEDSNTILAECIANNKTNNCLRFQRIPRRQHGVVVSRQWEVGDSMNNFAWQHGFLNIFQTI